MHAQIERDTTPTLPPAWITMSTFLSWSKSICNPETSITRIREPRRLCLPSKLNTLNGRRWARQHLSHKGKPLGSHKAGSKYPIHLNTPTMIGWPIGGTVHRKSSAGKVSHRSSILALGSLISEFPWDPSKASGLSQPLCMHIEGRKLLQE